MHRTSIAALLATLPIAAGSSDGEGESHWNQFRGPNGSGLAPDAKPLPAKLDPERNLAWKCALTGGHSSPCIWGERIFVTGAAGNRLETICVERATGKVLWTRAVEVPALERMHEVNGAATSTCATDGEHVIAHFGAFGLVAYDFDGQELWRRELPLPENTFGTAASPILAEGMLVFVRDTNGLSWLETLDPATGETIWRRERTGYESGWSTPILWRREDADEIVVYGVWRVTAYDLADGAERWSVPGLTDEPIVTPVTGEGLVFLTSYNMKTNTEVIGLPEFSKLLEDLDGDASGDLDAQEVEPNLSVLSRADADGEGDHPLRMFFRWLDADRDGKLTAKEYEALRAWVDGFAHVNGLVAIRPPTGDAPAEIVWQEPSGVPECPSPLYLDGCVFMVKNGGLATCVEAATGKLLWQERIGARGPWYSSPVAGDGKIYAASARGEVTVLAAGSEFRVLSSTDLGERIMATPALLDGTVYVRTDEHLWAFRDRAE